jgi:signal peptidase I
MTAPRDGDGDMAASGRETVVRRAARAVLVGAVRGRKERGHEWGEAVLAEFGDTQGDWDAVRWAAGGLRTVWHARRGRVRRLPRSVRLSRRVAVLAVLAVLAGLAVNRYVVTVGYMASGSMEPTLAVGDRYLVDKVSYRLTGLHRGDVIVIPGVSAAGDTPPPPARVKRVIGLPGDTIECRDGVVLRNGVAVNEPYLPPDAAEARTDCPAVTVSPHHLYVLGDHRLVSIDSRQDGLLSEDAVQARMLIRVWPFQR